MPAPARATRRGSLLIAAGVVLALAVLYMLAPPFLALAELAVYVGARLEALNKEYKTTTPIIISESTYEGAREAIEARRLGEVTVKGKSRPVVVYELLGLRDTAGG